MSTHRPKRQKARLSSIASRISQLSQHFQSQEMLPPPPQPLVSRDKSTNITDASISDINLHNIAGESNINDRKSVPFSPPLRVRNRHNAVYGQHLPNSFNSPACAAKVFGKKVSQREEMKVCSNLLTEGRSESGAMQNRTQTCTQQQQQKTAVLFDELESGPTDVDFDYTPSPKKSGLSEVVPANTPLFRSMLNSSRRSDSERDGTFAFPAEKSTERNFEDDDDALFASIDLDSIVAEHKSKSTKKPQNHYLQIGSTGSNGAFNANPAQSFQGDEHSSLSKSSIYHYYEHPVDQLDDGKDNVGLYNGNGSRNTAIDEFNASSMLDTTLGTFGQNSCENDIPLCPGHNERCRVCTAGTEANKGRQFYKCPRPEGEQCDFFEWADGMDGNLNALAPVGTGMYGTTGPISGTKDIFAENRRKFGHHSFREGQKEVIQHAVNGRDVFVLMPTGGGKSLCYQVCQLDASPIFSIVFVVICHV